MAKVLHFEVKSLRQLYLLFILISLTVALITSLAISYLTYPYKVQVKDKSPVYEAGLILYHDFNQDGFSEKVQIMNKKTTQEYYLLISPYTQGTYKIIDQFNFKDSLNIKWIFFGDYTGDGYDEMLVFTQHEDSLYVSVINVNLKKWILKRQYILGVQKPNPYHLWDIKEIFCRLLDVDNDWIPEIVFAIHSGFSQHPRGVFIYDIVTRRIINRVKFDSGINDMLLYDLTGDGKPEIIVSGHATGNIHKKTKYTDFKSWLFIFDLQLHFVIPPKSFGEFPSLISCQPLEINGKHNLLISYTYAGEKSLPDFLYLMDAAGKIIRKKALNNFNLKLSFIDRTSAEPIIYSYSVNGKLIKLDPHLNILQEIKIRKRILALLLLNNLNRDGKSYILYLLPNEFLIINQNLKIIARFPIKGRILPFWYKRYNGPNAPIEFALINSKFNYLFSLKKKNNFALFPFVLIGITVLVFILLLLLHRIMTFLNIYLTFFIFSLRKSSQGIMLLDCKGRVFYYNNRVAELLHPAEPILRKRYFNKIFINHAPIIKCFQQVFKLQKPFQCELNINDSNQSFKGEIIFTPFISPFRFVYAYLVEIYDHTQPILSDRLKVWSRSVQKMAHDIKQPLSTISLNLKALQMRLSEIDIPEKEEIHDDIRMMQTEMNKVRQITNNFLKFVNLETPKFQWIDLHEIIRNSITRFNPLLNGNLHIDFEFDSDITSLWADPRQLEIVLHVIIENAIDAMKGKGHIRIGTALVQDFENFDRQLVQLEIEDNGPGIKASVKEVVFEPFFTTKMDGTGMGLAIAKKIIEDHGGRIMIYSKEKIGTTVSILLPQSKS